MISPLPPLKPTPTSKELINFTFTDTSYKMSLMEKARVASTATEINSIMKELHDIYQKDCETLLHFHKHLDQKSNDLAQQTQKFNQLEQEYRTFKNNTSFIHLLENESLSQKNESLSKSILSIDEERQKHHPTPMRVDVNDVINKNENQMHKFLHLTELNFREIESLVYLLNKRYLAIDKSNELLGQVRKKFKNVSNLIQISKDLEKENESLKQNEMKYVQNPMTKRRQISQLSNYGIQSILLILQSSISSLYDYSDHLNQSIPKNEGIDFDSLCNDQEFLNHELNFDVETNNEQMTIEKALEDIQIQYKQLNSSEILKNRLLPKNFNEYSNNRANHLIKSNSQTLEDIRKKEIKHSSIDKEICELTNSIMNCIKEKQSLESFIGSAMNKLHHLANDHCIVLEKQYNNQLVLNDLNNIISSFGNSIVNNLDTSIKETIRNNYSQMRVPTTPHTIEKKKGKHHSLHLIAAELKQQEMKNASQQFGLELFVNSTKPIILIGLEKCLNLVKAESQEMPMNFTKDMKAELKLIRENLSTVIDDSQIDFKNQIQQLIECDRIILRKTYANEGLQVNLTHLINEHTQTEEIPNSKKK